MKTYDSFEHWFKEQSPTNQKIVTQLRKLVGTVAPQLVEASKWGNGVWLKGSLPIIYLHARSDHVQLGFFAGAAFADPKQLLQGKGKYVRHIRVGRTDDIDEAGFATMIRKAVRAPSYK